MITSSKIEQRAVALRDLAQTLTGNPLRRHHAHVRGHRLDDHRGDFPGVLLENSLDGGEIVVRRVQGERGSAAGTPGLDGNAKRGKPGARFDQEAIGVAVVAALEFQDQIALGESAGDANGGHGRLGAGADEANASRWKEWRGRCARPARFRAAKSCRSWCRVAPARRWQRQRRDAAWPRISAPQEQT